MRVLLDATGLGSGAGGDETMLTGALKGLMLAARPTDRFDVIAARGADLPDDVLTDPRFEIHRVARLPGALHFTTTMPWIASRTRPRPDLLFSPTHGPAISAIPVALMVQDLSFEHRPEDYPFLTRLRLQSMVRRQVRSARAVLTVSNHARSDLIATYGLDPDRVICIHNAALEPPSFSEIELARERELLAGEGVDGRFLLYLGNLHPRKNVKRAIEAFVSLRGARPDLSDLRFVIAGGRWWDGGEKEASLAAPPGSVIFLDRVDERRREVLLRSATALVYVSLFEGFGLPPLEAMARGTPVISSDRTSIPEVVGDAGLLVDPEDTASITRAMGAICTDADLRARLIAAGPERAAGFSVRSTGEALRSAFMAAMETHEDHTREARKMTKGRRHTVRTVDDYADDWEQNATHDARFAILSDPDRNDRAWDSDADAFIASGEQEIAGVFDHLSTMGLEPSRREMALDFGCGLGRLTNALGRRFERAIGVDISPTMVAEATELATTEGVSFVVNRSDRLEQFDDDTFDLIYSNIVLQHVSNDLQRGYLEEFCRVLAPGGIAVVQLPSSRRGFKGALVRYLPSGAVNALRRYARPAASLRREGYTIRMEMNCLPEAAVWDLVESHGCVVAHTTYTNAAVPDFNGGLEFMDRHVAWERAAGGGFLSPVYVIRKTTD